MLSLRQLVLWSETLMNCISIVLEDHIIILFWNPISKKLSEIDILIKNIDKKVLHNDMVICDYLSNILIFFFDKSIFAFSLKAFCYLVRSFTINILPFHKPDFFSFCHHIVKLINLAQFDDIWDCKE